MSHMTTWTVVSQASVSKLGFEVQIEKLMFLFKSDSFFVNNNNMFLFTPFAVCVDNIGIELLSVR